MQYWLGFCGKVRHLFCYMELMNIITGKEVKLMEERLLTEGEEEEINEINYEEDLVECETVGSY